MIKISNVDTDQYQIEDNEISLSKESTLEFIKENCIVKSTPEDVLQTLQVSGSVFLELSRIEKEVEGSLDKESWEPQKEYEPTSDEMEDALQKLKTVEWADNDQNRITDLPLYTYYLESKIPKRDVPEKYRNNHKWFFIVRRIPRDSPHSYFMDLYGVYNGGDIACIEPSIESDFENTNLLHPEASQKYSFRTKDTIGIFRYYNIVEGRVILVKTEASS